MRQQVQEIKKYTDGLKASTTIGTLVVNTEGNKETFSNNDSEHKYNVAITGFAPDVIWTVTSTRPGDVFTYNPDKSISITFDTNELSGGDPVVHTLTASSALAEEVKRTTKQWSYSE